ncbi:BTAD domain-containing putative transcriptional regulator [Roseobacteraceae bacterium S113]
MGDHGVDNHLTLLLFEGVELTTRDGGVRIASRKSRALLAYLFLSDTRTHARDALSQLLWPDVAARQARASLRQCLFDIRKQLGPDAANIFALAKEELRLPAEALRTDVGLVLEAVGQGHWLDADLSKLAQMGTVLSGYDSIGEEFADWLMQTRTALRARALQALDAGLRRPDQTPSRKIKLSQTALELDEFNEDFARTLMQLHVDAGQNSAALGVYDRLYKVLEDELDVEPSAETQKLAIQIKMLDGPAQSDVAPLVAAQVDKTSREGIAVLPFETLGPDPIPDYVALGLLDEVTCLLSSAPLPRIIASNSTRQYAGQLQDPATIGAALDVRYVVMGNVHQQPGETRISTQLVDTLTSGVERARMDRCEGTNLLAQQSDIAMRIASTVLPSVQLAELRRTQGFELDDLEPHHLYLRARSELFRLEAGSFLKARDLLEQSIDKAPYFAQAYGLLAEWHSINMWQGWAEDAQHSTLELERLARHALVLNPDDARSLALLAHHRVITHRRYDDAAQMFERAMQLLPNDAETLIWSVPSLAFTEQAERGIENANRALWLSPQDPFLFRNLHFLSIAQFAKGDFDEAAQSGQASLDLNPTYRSNMRMTIASLQRSGQGGAAARLAGDYMRQEPGFRVVTHAEKVAFRDPQARRSYGTALIEAGLPA